MATASVHHQRFLTHDQNRDKVCIVCMDKGGYSLTDIVLKRIRDFFISNFDPEERCCPNSICSKCRRDLYDLENGKKTVHDLPDPYDFDDILPHVRRLRLDESRYCECEICNVARTKSKLVSKRKRGRPSSDSSNNQTSMCAAVKMCLHCKGIIHRGISHRCNLSNLRKNLIDMCESVDERTKEVVAYRVISDKVKDESAKSIKLKSPGPFPLKINVNPKEDTTTFSSSDISSLQLALGTSNRSVHRKLLPFIRRISHNRHAVQAHTPQFLHDRDQQLAKYFSVTLMKLDTGNNKEELREVVYCTDVEDFIDTISSKRDIDLDNRSVKIGIDGGGGFLKFCLSVYVDEDVETPHPKDSFANTSVKKIFIIAIVQDVKESYINVLRILEILNIQQVSMNCMYALDLKLANIVAGLQAHGSTHPCLWCVCPKREFGKDSESQHHVRSLGSVRNFANDFQCERSHSDKVQAKDFKNCIHPPLVFGDDSNLFIHHIPLPELHLLLRTTNKILKEMELVSEEVAFQFYTDLGIIRPKLHGGEFTGNACKKILQNVHVFESILARARQDSRKLLKFAECLKCLNEVRIACFGSVLNGGFVERIRYFRKAYLDLEISVTTSVHVLFVHVIQFCLFHKAPLGPYSEQASESVHQDFHAAWVQCGKVDIINKNYGNNLLAAIIRYNGRHL